MTKIQLAKLEKIDPMTKEWREKLTHIQSALQQHMYQEEDSWLPDLVEKLPLPEKTRMTRRFIEEYERYCGEGTAELRAGVPLAST
jgi:iron-sulfur cluster repair protein YtfE (RIC family)|tara:strand:- start:8695 stop:8952 length:258 start_codon:yes stop_codon:yes gene_type:complete